MNQTNLMHFYLSQQLYFFNEIYTNESKIDFES